MLTIGLILWLTLAPDPVGELDVPLFEGIDKVVHACMFGFLAGIIWFDAGRRRGRWHTPSLAHRTLFCCEALLLGIAIEFAQKQMAMGRGFEPADMLADAAGCLLAWLLLPLIAR